MPIVRDTDVKFQQSAPGIKIRYLVNQEIGALTTTLGEVIMEPGSSLLLHTHNKEEAFFVTEGIATLVLDDDTYTLEANSTALAPAGVRHLLANKSQRPMRFVFFHPTVQVQREVVEG